MNLLTINPISSCNINCEHCPNKKWTYPVDDEHNRLTNKIILKWLNMYFNPYEWFLEISGGEPGLYPEISELLLALDSSGYYGIIRTNGTLPIPKIKSFKRVTAWHKPISLANPPRYYDYMLITKNPDDCWRDKVKYCSDNDIPYKCVPYIRYGDPLAEEESPQGEIKNNDFFEDWTIVNSSGEQAYCYAEWGDEKDNILNMSPPLHRNVRKYCPWCHGVLGTLEFLDDELKNFLTLRKQKHVANIM